MKKLLVLLLLLIGVTLSACTPDEDVPEEIDTNLYTTYTDNLLMDFSYDGMEFIADGIGEVTLDKCTDGDTAQFTSGGTNFSVRFLGIDTPESTYRIDPWGKEASAYTCDKLENATTIVLEADGDRQDGYGRYLAWVWYDGRLLNLELVEQAYTGANNVSDTKYETVFYDVDFSVQETDRRVWGEQDPNFDYSLDGTQVTIEELATNPELYEQTKIVIVGIVAVEVNGDPYMVDGSGYGIYLYLGSNNSVYVAPGNEVRIEGLNLTYYPDKETGSPQLTGFNKRNIDLISEDNVVTPREIEVGDIERIDLGSYVQVRDIEVTDVYYSTNTGDFTITCEDASGNEIGLHVQSIDQNEGEALFTVGSTFDVAGPLSRYMGQYQLELSNLNSVVKK